MFEIIWKLREDHKKLARLLDLIAREVRHFGAGERADYELVEIILEYVLNYPDLFHHPLENQVYAKLVEIDPAVAGSIGELDMENAELGQLTRRFAAALQNFMQDEELHRDWFVEVASDYLTYQRHHMQMEEFLFFPAALRTLSPGDWDEIARDYEAPDDPLFEVGTARDKYDRLHQEVLK
ncbi:MAG: hemerythrin domain-containing protein [Rhodospirillaceae bacterium]